MKNPPNSLLIILTLGILTAITSISIDIYLPAFGVIASYFKVPIVKIESTVTVFLFGMAFGQLFIGPLSDVYGRKTPLRLGLVIYIMSSICCVFTSSFALFITLRLVQGLAGSSCQVISRALVNDIYKDKNAAHIFTILQIIMGISPIISPVVGGMLAGDATWKYLFLIMAVVSGIALLGCLLVLPAEKDFVKKRTLHFKTLLKSYSECIRHPAFVNSALVRAISNSAAFSFVTGSPFVFTQLYGIDKKHFGFLFTGLATGMILVGVLNTKLIKHFEIPQIIKFAVACQVITGLMMVMALYFNASFIILIGLIFLFLSMLGLILPNATSLYIGAMPSHSGVSSALIGALSYLSAFLITSLLSLLHNNTAYPMIMMMSCCAIFAYFFLQHRSIKHKGV